MRSYEIRFWITWRSSLQNCAMTLRHQKPGVPMDQQKPYDLVHLRSIDAEGRKGHGMALVDGGGWWWAEDWTVKTHSFDIICSR